MSASSERGLEHRDAVPGDVPSALLAIRRQLADGDLAGAEQSLDLASARWPAQPGFVEERMALLLARGAAADVVRMANALLARHPRRARALDLLLESLASRSDSAGIVAAVESHACRPFTPAVLRHLIVARHRLGHDAEALADVGEWLETQADSFALRALLNRLPEATSDDRDFAMKVARFGCLHWPGDADMLGRAARLAMLAKAWDWATWWLDAYTRIRPDAQRQLVMLANCAFFESGDVPLTIRAAEQVLALDPDNLSMRLLASHARFLGGQRAQSLRHATAGLNHPDASDEQRWMFASLVHASDERSKPEDQLRDVLDDGAAPAFVLLRHGVQAWIPAEAETVVVYFGSIHYSWSLGFSALRALLPPSTGVLFLQDFSRTFFLGGIPSLGDDFATTLEALRGILPPSASLLGLGFSGGGYAALLYGIELGVRRYLLFAAPTDGRSEAMLEPHAMSPRFRRLRTEFPDQLVNLRDVMSRRPERPRLDLWFGSGATWDRQNAHRLAGLENVHLHEIPGCDTHDLLGYMEANGTLEPVLRDWLWGGGQDVGGSPES